MSDLRDKSRNTLKLVRESLNGQLNEHMHQAMLLARNPAYTELLEAPTPAATQMVNEDLEKIQQISGASDIYILDVNGVAIAASNWRLPYSFIGKNYNYRPYYTSAISGSTGFFFGIGMASKERGYYFSSAIKSGDAIVGVMVVKVGVGQLEQTWKAADHEVLVVDENGVVFLSSNPQWHFNILAPLSKAAAERISLTRQYEGVQHTLLNLKPSTYRSNSFNIVSIGPTFNERGKTHSEPSSFLQEETELREAHWRIILLARTDDVDYQSRLAFAIFTFIGFTVALAIAIAYLRRQRIREKMALKDRLNSQLEQRVAERTQDLSIANQNLQHEILEHLRTEAELKTTQAELIQATKLAALGQLSAGISHELNQPLAAIRSYAENAQLFLARGQPTMIASNLSAISELTELMARIIRHLRTFARKEPSTIQPVELCSVIQQASELVHMRIDSEGVTLKKDIPPHDIVVMGGQVRLQQVFVNIFNNAMDAMAASARKHIELRIIDDEEFVTIVLRDTGTGISPHNMINLFDPFFTTKPVGQGLGLGLSITYGIIKQFGGTIEATNHPDGGAIFIIKLKPAKIAEPCLVQ